MSTWFAAESPRLRTSARRRVRARRRDRDRGRAVPALCDRTPRQSHARLRDVDAAAPRRLRRDHDRAGRRGRWRRRGGRRPGDARRGGLRSFPCAHESDTPSTAGTAALGTRGVRRGSRHSRTRFATAFEPLRRSASFSPRRSRIACRRSSSGSPRRRYADTTGESLAGLRTTSCSSRVQPRRHQDRVAAARSDTARTSRPARWSPRRGLALDRDGAPPGGGTNLSWPRSRLRAQDRQAGDQERRRLERDLHDGAQQRLVSLGVQVRRLELEVCPAKRRTLPALDQIVAEVGAAIADRQIAAGVRPARLDEGVAAALPTRAYLAVPVDVEAPRAAARQRRGSPPTSSRAKRSTNAVKCMDRLEGDHLFVRSRRWYAARHRCGRRCRRCRCRRAVMLLRVDARPGVRQRAELRHAGLRDGSRRRHLSRWNECDADLPRHRETGRVAGCPATFSCEARPAACVNVVDCTCAASLCSPRERGIATMENKVACEGLGRARRDHPPPPRARNGRQPSMSRPRRRARSGARAAGRASGGSGSPARRGTGAPASPIVEAPAARDLQRLLDGADDGVARRCRGG